MRLAIARAVKEPTQTPICKLRVSIKGDQGTQDVANVSSQAPQFAATAFGAFLSLAVLAQTTPVDATLPVDDAADRVAVGEYLDAINIVELEIGRIEQRASRYHIDLARPLVVLGDALAGVGDRDGALGAYNRALHITRVNRGLHDPTQVDIVYREAAVLAAKGQVRKANKRHEYAYEVLLRSYGGGNPELLPGMFSLGDWYLTNYNIFAARALYELALSVADDSLGAADPNRIRALRGVAQTYRSERFPPYQEEMARRGNAAPQTTYRYGTLPRIGNFSKGERALIEVVKVLRTRDQPPEDVAAAVLDLGDWYLLFGKYDRARALYRRTWELLEADAELRATTFDAPTPLYLPLPTDAGDREKFAGPPRNGVLELSFRVDESGDLSEIQILHADPQDMLDTKVRRAMRHARYRPTFDGQATQATDDVRMSHEFIYYGDEPDPDSTAAAPPKAPRGAETESAWHLAATPQRRPGRTGRVR